MKVVRFGDLYAIPSGNGLSRPTAVRGEGFRMIGMGELFANDIISDMEMDRVQMSEREKKTFFIEIGDLLFARQSLVAAGAGKCSIVKELREPTTYESHLIRVRLDSKKCNPWFYYYLFKLPDNPIKAIVNQCAQAGIRGNELAKVKVPLLNRVDQDKIASILSAYDNLIENNNKRIKILEQMAENLYKEWFVRFRFPGHETTPFENGIPKGWELRPLFDVASVTYGFPFKSELFNNDESLNAVVRIRDILDNKTDTYTSESCDNRYLIKENAILIGMDGLFHMCLWNGSRAFLNQRVVMLNSKDDNICNYLLYLSVKPQIKFWEQTISGTTVAHLGDKHLKKVTVLVPTQSILKKANERLQAYMEQKRSLFIMNQNLIKQRDLLLPRLMSGKLAV